MKDNPSIAELQLLLEKTPRVHPQITQDARALLGSTAETIEQLGLPVEHADLFRADEEIAFFQEAEGARYEINGESAEILRPVRIGRNRFGVITLDCSSGHVVYVDETSETQLINTSLERFLYFVGRFNRSAEIRYSDISKLRSDFEEVDPAPLRNEEGIWSATIEEAEAGLY